LGLVLFVFSRPYKKSQGLECEPVLLLKSPLNSFQTYNNYIILSFAIWLSGEEKQKLLLWKLGKLSLFMHRSHTRAQTDSAESQQHKRKSNDLQSAPQLTLVDPTNRNVVIDGIKRLKTSLESSETLAQTIETFPFEQFKTIAQLFNLPLPSEITKQEAQIKVRQEIEKKKEMANHIALVLLGEKDNIKKWSEENYNTLDLLKQMNVPALANFKIPTKCHLCEECYPSKPSIFQFCCKEGEMSVCAGCLLQMAYMGNNTCPFCKARLRLKPRERTRERTRQESPIDLSAQ
jgi:hypothetical protein